MVTNKTNADYRRCHCEVARGNCSGWIYPTWNRGINATATFLIWRFGVECNKNY